MEVSYLLAPHGSGLNSGLLTPSLAVPQQPQTRMDAVKEHISQSLRTSLPIQLHPSFSLYVWGEEAGSLKLSFLIDYSLSRTFNYLLQILTYKTMIRHNHNDIYAIQCVL